MSVLERFQAGNRLSKTTSGALFSAILALLFLISEYLPVFGAVAVFFCPVPIVLTQLRFNDLRHTLLVTLVASALIGIFSGVLLAFSFLLATGLPGVFLGMAVAAKKDALFSIATCAIAFVISTTVALYVMAPLLGMNVSMEKNFEVFSRQMEKVRQDNAESLRKNGMAEDQVKKIDEMYRQSIEMIKNGHLYTPFFILMAALFSSFVNYRVAVMALSKLKIDIADVQDFDKWRVPWSFLWGFIVGLLLVNVFDEKATGIYRQFNLAGKNINALYLTVFFINGLAVAHYYLKFYKINLAFRFFIYLMFILNPFFQTLVLMAGLMDPWMDLRKLEGNGNDDENQPTKEV